MNHGIIFAFQRQGIFMQQCILEKHAEEKTEPLFLSMSQTNPIIGISKLFQIKTEGKFEVQQLF